MTAPFSITLTITAACLALFILLLELRWFSRFSRGYMITLFLAIGGLSFLSAWTLGNREYHEARKLLFYDRVHELEALGNLAEGRVRDEINDIMTELRDAAHDCVPYVASEIDRGKLADELAALDHFETRILQITVLDAAGQRLFQTQATGFHEPQREAALKATASGREYVSEAYLSDAFHKYVIYMAVPIRAEDGRVYGALTARYAIENELNALVRDVRFGEHGTVVVTNEDGRVMAHADPRRLHADLSRAAGVMDALAGHVGWSIYTSSEGVRQLGAHLPMRNPSTVDGARPWVLVANLPVSEVMGPLDQMARDYELGLLGITLASLLLARLLSSTLDRPLRALRLFADRVGKGDFTVRNPLAGRDELAQLGGTLDHMVRGLEEREHIKDLFGRYVTTQVSEEVLKGKIRLGGEMRRVTVLFSDIRDFTRMSEQMEPGAVVEFLNDYFSEMVEVVFEYGGRLDKFIGDGMMAVFGEFDGEQDHPLRAVRTALRMQERLAHLNKQRARRGEDSIAIGIGIHTDDVIVGNIGSRRRLDYTVIGDGVNTSARVEALNKEFGTTVLITETTYASVSGQFECRAMPAATLKGKQKMLAFYEVLGPKDKHAAK